MTEAKAKTVESGSCQFVANGFGPQGQIPIRVETVVTGLNVPWELAFLPNQNMLVFERAGQVQLVQNAKLRCQAIATINISSQGEGRALCIATHPNCANNQFFYVYFTATANGTEVNRVERETST